ncbi:MAG: mechanosensitive ion channel [bacterium]|nr:mechanosensitive ion channel family protein [Acidimicrobiia bacterium]MCY4648814.1 mechanosensitive ion channel [bacterium]
MWESVTEWQFIEETLGTVVTVLGVWILYGFVRRMGRRLVQEMTERGEDGGARAASLWSLVRRVILIAFLATGGLMVIAVWGLPLAPFLAVGSAAGVAIGLGARGLVQDVIAGFFILAEDQYRIGDKIKSGAATGQVVDIRPRVTILRDEEGNTYYVPNGSLGGSVSIVFPSESPEDGEGS